MNYALLTGAKFVLKINVGASPYAIICRPYGTYLLQSFYRTPLNSFKNRAIADYIDFRKKVNEEYAAFMEEAWKQYKVVAKVSLPKDYNRPRIEWDGKQKNGESIDYDGVTSHEDIEFNPQPKPITPIPENDKNLQYFAFSYNGTTMKVVSVLRWW